MVFFFVLILHSFALSIKIVFNSAPIFNADVFSFCKISKSFLLVSCDVIPSRNLFLEILLKIKFESESRGFSKKSSGFFLLHSKRLCYIWNNDPKAKGYIHQHEILIFYGGNYLGSINSHLTAIYAIYALIAIYFLNICKFRHTNLLNKLTSSCLLIINVIYLILHLMPPKLWGFGDVVGVLPLRAHISPYILPTCGKGKTFETCAPNSIFSHFHILRGGPFLNS